MRIKLTLGFVLLLGTNHLFGQAPPSAFERSIPLKLGAGYSNFSSDWNGRIAGPALWTDWSLIHAPGLLNRLSIEAQVRHLHEDQSSFHLTYNTISGGPIYNFKTGQQRWVRPYAGFLLGYGQFKFAPAVKGYSNDSRTIYGPMGGAEFPVFSRLKVRAAYEYQYWPDLFHGHALTPNGFTIGTAYDFGEKSSRVY